MPLPRLPAHPAAGRERPRVRGRPRALRAVPPAPPGGADPLRARPRARTRAGSSYRSRRLSARRSAHRIRAVDPTTISVTVARRREDVFEYLADIANHAEFTDHFLVDWHLLREDTYGEGAGARFRI